MNTPDIDPVRLAAEADAALMDAPEDAAIPGAEVSHELMAEPEKWGPFLKGMLQKPIFGMVIPQWGIEPEMQEGWLDALGQCCDQVFPGGPAGQYACWAQLFCGTTVIVGMTYIQNGGKFPPLGPKRMESKTDAASTEAAANKAA